MLRIETLMKRNLKSWGRFYDDNGERRAAIGDPGDL